MKVVPIKDNVLLTPVVDESSKIILTTEAKPDFYKVVEVGSDVTLFQKYDKVIPCEYGMRRVTIEGVEYVIAKEDAILVKVV